MGDASDAAAGKPLAPIANVKDRRKDFDAHWAMADEGSGAVDASHDASDRGATGLSRNKQQALKTVSSQWEASDGAPAADLNAPESRVLHGAGAKENTGIKTGGDGMGGRKGQARQWGFGDDDDDEAMSHPVAPKGAGRKDGGTRTQGFWES